MAKKQKKKISFLILLLSFVLFANCSKNNEKKQTVLCHNEQFGINKQKMVFKPICVFQGKKMGLGNSILDVFRICNKLRGRDTLIWAYNNSDNSIYARCLGDRNYYRLSNNDKNISLHESFMFTDSLLYSYKAKIQMPNSLPMEKVKQNILKYFPCITFEKNGTKTKNIFNGLVVETLYFERNGVHNTIDFVIEYSYNTSQIKY